MHPTTSFRDPSAAAQSATPALLARAAVASFIGNFVEWFDYASYGYLATVISAVFFPTTSRRSALLATFGVFAISFIVRPIGGILWGHLGDRIGRRIALSLSILIMSAATFLIALLPTYDQIGWLSPALLLGVRLIQGFSAAGEYAGASLFLAEYAPEGRRGIFTSIVPASTAAGLLVGSLLVALMHAILTSNQLLSWGWRLPFALAAPLGLIGRYIRLRLADTPKFAQLEAAHHRSNAPISELFRSHKRSMLVAAGVTSLNAVAFYIVLSYVPTYLSTELNLGESRSFLATTISLAAYIVLIFCMGTLSDRVGRKTMLAAACVLFMLLSVPLFMELGKSGFVGIVAIQILIGAFLTMNDGTLASFLSEAFPTNVRFSGFAFTFNSANALFGGTAPLIATWLIAASGSKVAPAWFLSGAAAVALVAVISSRETAWDALKEA